MSISPVANKIRDTYDPVKALRICELIAEGKTIADIVREPDLPSRNTIYRWLSVYPKFFDAFERAREVSAMSFEEEALTMARKLAGANDFTGVKVQAYNYAMQQLRWSASRRDKTRYGQAIAPTNVTVPIQINTTLNLGQEGQPPATDTEQSIFTVEAIVTPSVGVIEDIDESILDLTASGEVVDLSAGPEDTVDTSGVDLGLPFGLPERERQDLHSLVPGKTSPRPKPRRKSPAATAATATKAAARLKKGTS